MNKGELVEAVVAETGLSKKDAEAAVNSVVSSVTETLKKHEDVQLVGFGTFKSTERAAGTARNPATGETIKVPAKWVVKFTAGKALKDAVNTSAKKKKK